MGLFEQLGPLGHLWSDGDASGQAKPLGLLALREKMPVGIPTQVAVLATAFLLLTVVRRRYFSPISAIPGPPLASISRLWHVWHIIKGDQHVVVAKQHEIHGPFVRIAHNEVSVCHADAPKTLFGPTLHKADWYKVFANPDYRTRASMGIQSPRDKAQLNKYFKEGFLHNNVIRYEAHMDGVIRTLLTRLDEAADARAPVRLGDYFSYAAYDITGEITFSASFGFTEQGRDIDDAIATNEGVMRFFAVLGHFIWASYLIANPFTTWAGLSSVGHKGMITKRALEARKKNPDARFDLAAFWLRALDRAGPGNEHWNEPRMMAAAMGNLEAGSDTVSCGLQSFVYHLLRHPDGWQRIQDEIDNASKEGRCRDAIITYDDAAKLPYLQAALKEGLRIFAPAPMPQPRVAPKGGLTFDQTHFPEGTVLSLSSAVMQTSKTLWGPDADEFRPERWLAPDAAELDRLFCPWGGGWAACPGQFLARIQMSKIAATLVRDYDVRQVNPGEEWTWKAYVTVVPKGWPVYLKRRE